MNWSIIEPVHADTEWQYSTKQKLAASENRDNSFLSKTSTSKEILVFSSCDTFLIQIIYSISDRSALLGFARLHQIQFQTLEKIWDSRKIQPNLGS